MFINGGITFTGGLTLTPALAALGFTSPALMNGSTSAAYPYAVAVNSSGLFVAVLQAGGVWGYATSTNGITWTTPALMPGSVVGAPNAITVNSSGLFVAVGNRSADSAPLYATSTDGSTWSTPALMNGSTSYANMSAIAVNSSGLFVAVGSNSSSQSVYATSTNGSTWTTPALMPGGIAFTPTSMAVNSSGLFVAVGFQNNGGGATPYPFTYASSSNGSTWTTPTVTTSYNATKMVVAVNSSGLFVVAYTYSVAAFATSSNGTSWSAFTNIPGIRFTVAAITCSTAGIFVIVGSTTTGTYPAFTSSLDGTTWNSAITMNNSTTYAALTGLAVNSSGRFAAIGDNAANQPVAAYGLY